MADSELVAGENPDSASDSAGNSKGNSAGGDLNIAQGTEHLEMILRSTHGAVGDGSVLEPERAIGPTECTDATNVGQGTYFSTRGFNFQSSNLSATLEAVAEQWQAAGYEIDRRRFDEPNPQLLGKSDGFSFRALAVTAKGIVNLAGDTPCLPPVEG